MGIFKNVPSVPDLVENRIVAQTSVRLDEVQMVDEVLIRFQDSDQIHSFSPSPQRFDRSTLQEAQLLQRGDACQTTSRWIPDEFGSWRAHFEIVGIRAGHPNPAGVSPAQGRAIRDAAPRSDGFELTANNALGLATVAFFLGAIVFVISTVVDAKREAEANRAPVENPYITPYPNRPRVPASGPVPLRPSPPSASPPRAPMMTLPVL